jgi:hypothetical protein
MGKDPAPINRYKGVMVESGYKHIIERKYAVPINSWAPGRHSKHLGEMNKTNIMDGMRPLSSAVLTRGLGMTQDEVEELVVAAQKDMHDTRIHGFLTL